MILLAYTQYQEIAVHWDLRKALQKHTPLMTMHNVFPGSTSRINRWYGRAVR
jgi:hypothetical protein